MFAGPPLLYLGQPWIFPASQESLRDQIMVGMSVDEVQHLIGGPAEQAHYEDTRMLWVYNCDFIGSEFFYVWFDAGGRVTRTKVVA